MKGLSDESHGDPEGREAPSAREETSGKATRVCDACGARARREAARFCATCGHALGGGYFPTDSLRASYRFESAPVSHSLEASRGPFVKHARRGAYARRPPARAGREFMPRRSESGPAALAMAFVTYALVPYLGILFCPGALLFGGVGLVRAWRAPRPGHARAAALSLVLGLVVLCAQLLLWWILYKVPEWARQSPF
ncbi:MAG: hypothetical protein JOZ02_03580 [Acidobacteria bacterium]|nr:hypothetical protein [Acidobacteriota bacterium]